MQITLILNCNGNNRNMIINQHHHCTMCQRFNFVFLSSSTWIHRPNLFFSTIFKHANSQNIQQKIYLVMSFNSCLTVLLLCIEKYKIDSIQLRFSVSFTVVCYCPIYMSIASAGNISAK